MAALTSFATRPLRGKIPELVGQGIRDIDLYCFQREDIESVAPRTTAMRQGESSWAERMLHLIDPSEAAHRIRSICLGAEQSHPAPPDEDGKVDVLAFATFLPDISSPDEPTRRTAAQVIVRFLELARKLQEPDSDGRGFSCLALELVAGQIIIWPTTQDPREPVLRYVPREMCYAAVERSLEEICAEVPRIYPPGCGFRPPALAFEVEPGACRLVNNAEALERLLKVLGNLPNPPLDIGINIDIGHMLICGLAPSAIFGTEIGKRVVHAHLSDNARSHFADLVPGRYHDVSEFRPWIEGLQELHAAGTGMYRGGISLELECCQDVGQVKAAFDVAQGLLRGAQAG